MCGGRGTIAVDMRGRVVPYACDDLCDFEPCEECNGSGTALECYYCCEQRWQDEAEEDNERANRHG